MCCLCPGDHGAALEGGVQRAGRVSRQHQCRHLHPETLREVAAEARESSLTRFSRETEPCLFFRLMLPYEEHLRVGGAHFKVPETLEPPKPRAIRGRRPLPRGRRPGPKAKERKAATSAAPHPPAEAVSTDHGAVQTVSALCLCSIKLLDKRCSSSLK